MRKTCGRRRLPIGQLDPRPGAEVHLGLLAGLALHPPKRQRPRPSQPGHEPPHAVILVAKPLGPQVLVDPLTRKPCSNFSRITCRYGSQALRQLPSPRKLRPSKRAVPAARLGGDSAWTKAPETGSEPRALWLVLISEPRGALAGFELGGWYVRQEGTIGRLRSPSLPGRLRPPRAFPDLRRPGRRPHPSRGALWLVLDRNCLPGCTLRPSPGQHPTPEQSAVAASPVRVISRSLVYPPP